MKAALPSLSPLQFAVISALDYGMSGRELRLRLKQRGIKKAGPAFYQLMSRMEDAGFVDGWYEQKIIGGQIIKQRYYRRLPEGTRAWSQCIAFYENKP